MELKSGGQTGGDRGVLLAAMDLDFGWGGWAPKGWRSEDGTIPELFRAPKDGNSWGLVEAPSPEYPVRTRMNVRDSDATVALYRGSIGRGTMLAIDEARRIGRPRLEVDIDRDSPEQVCDWMSWYRAVNFAGSRDPKFEEPVREYMRKVLRFHELCPLYR